MVALAQGEVWWAELPAPTGSGPGFRRPVVVVQADSLRVGKLGPKRLAQVLSGIDVVLGR